MLIIMLCVQKLCWTAGVDGQAIVFLLTDSQIVSESFLEDVNNMLNSGEVPGLYAADEKERIVASVREWVESTTGTTSKASSAPDCFLPLMF